MSSAKQTERKVSIEDIEIKDDNPLRKSKSKVAGSSNATPPKPKKYAKVTDIEDKSSAAVAVQSPPSSPPSSPQRDDNPLNKSTTIPSLEVAKSKDKKEKENIYLGKKPLQYALWAHYMGYGAAMLCTWFGITALLWSSSHFYACRVDGEDIYSGYIQNATGICDSKHNDAYVCCNPFDESKLEGSIPLGALYLIYGIVNIFIENYDWGFGLWFPNNTLFYARGISPLGTLHIIVGIAGLSHYSTCVAGVCLFSTGVIYWIATWRMEAGDGGREHRYKARSKEGNSSIYSYTASFVPDLSEVSFNPVSFCQRIYNEDKLSSYVWVGIYLGVNLLLFIYTLEVWYEAVEAMKEGLVKGNLDINCETPECELNRIIIRSGPASSFAPWAKACGNCLNLNCSLILFPVVKLILRKINNSGTSYSRFQSSGGFMTRFFAHPITRYVPLQKNIEFHKICAMSIFLFAWAHTIFHCLNLARACKTTLKIFRALQWDGTDFFTGAVVVVAMFFIYSAAPDIVRHAKFEIFFNSHHFFVIFFIFMLQHGPVFIYWVAIPLALYIVERILQMRRGSNPFIVTKVEWIPPVMAVQFRPINKVCV
jgi:hypothetical protein